MAPRKEHQLFNKYLWVEGDLLDLMWAELERGAVPVTHLCSQVHFPLLLVLLSNSENYISQAPLPTGLGWETLAADGRPGASSPSPSSLLGQHCWQWPCLLCGCSFCQTHPPWLQLPSGGPGSWALGIPLSFQPREDRAFLLMLILESLHLPLFGILALQLLKQQIAWIKSPLSEIPRNDFCLTACTVSDTGDKLPLMEKSSIGSGLENNDGLEGRLSLWERKGERPPKKQQKFQLRAETVLMRQCHSKPGRSLKRLRRVLCLHECFNQIQGQNVDQEKIPQGQKDLDPVHLFIFHQV